MFTGLPPCAWAQTGVNLDEARADLDAAGLASPGVRAIDAALATGGTTVRAVVQKSGVRGLEAYRVYLDKAAGVSASLLKVGETMDRHGGALNLQKLAALTQAVSLENQAFAESFTRGEEGFASYQLIQKAVENLEDAVRYWRMADRYRQTYRGTQQERELDDEVLRVKLQAARMAIDELKALQEARATLDRDLEPALP